MKDRRKPLKDLNIFKSFFKFIMKIFVKPTPKVTTHKIVIEGWMNKKCKRLQIWKPRYFVLLSNGALMKFNQKPAFKSVINPINYLEIKNCEVVPNSNPKLQNLFKVKFALSKLEKCFYTKTEEEKTAWVEALKYVLIKPTESYLPAIKSRDHASKTQSLSDFRREPISPYDFEFLHVLGRGGYGRVFLCRDTHTKEVCAMKIIDKRGLIKYGHTHRAYVENKVFMNVDHPFLMSLRNSLQTQTCIAFTMEYMPGGDLYGLLQRKEVLHEDHARFYISEIVLAVRYLHKKNVIHRDLKLPNVLIGLDGHVKVSDFGLCKLDISADGKTNTFCGTPEYIAPEVVKFQAYGPSVDWWAVGVMSYRMLYGRMPFAHHNIETLLGRVAYDILEFPHSITYYARNFLQRLLAKEPIFRLGCGNRKDQDILTHKYFSFYTWEEVKHKKVVPPFIPHLACDSDVKYFDVPCPPVENLSLSLCDSEKSADKKTADLFADFDFQDYRMVPISSNSDN